MEAIKRSKPYMGNEAEPEGAPVTVTPVCPSCGAEDRIPMRHNYTKILIMVANYYGVGDSVEEAKANLKKIRGSALKAREAQVWWVVSGDTAVDQVSGGLIYPRPGSKPFEINRVDEK